MQYFGLNVKDVKFGVVGLGGLGYMVVKFVKVFGMYVIVFSIFLNKEKEVCNILGVDDFVVSKNEDVMNVKVKFIDFIIDMIVVKYEFGLYFIILKINGKLCFVGMFEYVLEVSFVQFVIGCKLVVGSLIGGIQEIVEMLEFCGKNNIFCMVEMVLVLECNIVMECLVKNDVKYWFVLDMKNIV